MTLTKLAPAFVGFEGSCEAQFDGCWRIYNGSVWTHSFVNEVDAVAMCQEWGGKAVAMAAYDAVAGCCSYTDVSYPN